MDQILLHAPFFAAAFCVLLSSLGVVLARRPLISALWLVASLLGTAAIYAQLSAHFLAVIQVMVYAGAIVAVMVLVLMLLGDGRESFRWGALAVGGAAAVSAGALALAVASVLSGSAADNPHLFAPQAAPAGFGGPKAAGIDLFTRYLFPFEAISLLILAALVGAVMTARKGK